MLVRSAGRRQRRHTARILAASFAQLNLPWLAPAQLRWSASQASIAAESPSRPRRQSPPTALRARPQTRHLATATDQYTPSQVGQFPPPVYSTGFRNDSQDKNVPWDLPPKSQPIGRRPEPRLSTLRPYNDPIIINTTIQTPAPLLRVQHGVHGTTKDLLQHLHTSLLIGRMNRAEAIIQRLAEQCAPNAPELLHAHTAYLEEFLRTLASQGKGTDQAQKTLVAMQKWFEVEVRNKNIQPDGKLFVIMIRAAIRGLDGNRRDRSIRRYADWAEKVSADTYDEALYSEDYDDNEFTILGRATSELYENAPSIEAPETQLHALDEPQTFTPRQDTVHMTEFPEVLATEQKGGGLQGIKRAMHTFIDLPALAKDAPLEAQRERAFERQQLMEETSVNIAVERWRKADEELRKIGIHTAMQSKPLGALMWQWYQALLPLLEKELAEVKKMLDQPDVRKEDERYHYGPLLEALPIQKVAANTILWIMSRMARGKDRDTGHSNVEMKLNGLTTGLGKQIEAECSAEISQKMMKGSSLSKQRQTKQAKNSRQRRKQYNIQTASVQTGWPLGPKVKLGALLVEKLIESAHLPVTREHPRTKKKITQMQPAFLHRIKYVLGKKIGVVTPNPALVDKLQSEPLGSLIAKRMPMLVEPKPWSGWSTGGYLHYPNPIMRLAVGDKSGKDYFLAADRQGDMGQLYAGLTALSKVSWKVHPDVFKVQLEAWNSGEAIANFAPLHPQFDVPPEPEAVADPTARRRWLTELRDIENKRAGLHSQRCFQNFQLEIARAVVNETLYFPHNMDFRGRAYPIPPYLNHMGADNVRGLLVFGEGKELGPTGLRWLKIHLATVAGHDKASLEERIQFTMDHLDDIYDSVRNPLGGRRWWLEAEDAWQTLAACFELTKALDSPDPTKFISSLPIQQDGTCNGLQHYAALGGDEIGARQVNLEPGDRPADVYTAVAEAVKLEVQKDAELGNPVAQKLHGNITRKCVKQPVMTNVYGVTFYGAKAQVRKQLEVIFPDVKASDEINLSHLSDYVAKKIFKSLGTMFGGAQSIQHWLGQCADRIATCLTPEQIEQLTSAKGDVAAPKKKGGRSTPAATKVGRDTQTAIKNATITPSTGTLDSNQALMKSAKPLFKSTVVWTTPLRLPVVQPYRKTKSVAVKTNLQGIYLQEPQVWDPVSKRKQLQAFPPNFIHSLDATHMLLSALKCSEAGMTFASIHDSFWTHACDVDDLSRTLRDAFVEMHSEDIIGRLKEEFQTRYKGCMYLASVLTDSKAGKSVTELRKKTIKDLAEGKTSELALEAERMRLINSEDSKERERGQAMITPGSIVASLGDDSALAAPTEMNGQALGDMPENADLGVEATNSDADHLSGSAEATESPEEMDRADPDLDGAEDAQYGHDPTSLPNAAKGMNSKRYQRKIYVWLPMAFPEVPKKGGFDVRRLRASKYFFH